MRLLVRFALFCLLAASFVWAADHALAQQVGAETASADCVEGYAGIYPCHNVNLLGHLSLTEMGAAEGVMGNDLWGWTDPDTGKKYVIFGFSDSTSFIDVTDPANPLYLGNLPGHDGPSQWRDMQVYQNYAFITADIPTQSGIQVFDLTRLRDVANPPVTFTADAHYDGFGAGHNLWANQETGYLYAFRSDTCSAAIHMINIQDSLNPTFVGCAATDDAPLSDSECLLYNGPDAAYTGRELCFTGSDDNMSIDDVTDKDNPVAVARFGYPQIGRAHQGSLTPDHRYWLMSDMNDEHHMGFNTRTHAFDITDLEAPVYLGYYEHATTSMDHNLYIVDNLVYEANFTSGLRILDISDLPSIDFTEVGYFDVMPDTDSIAMSGAWSNYPFWNEFVAVSDTENGLFLLQYVPDEPTSVGLSQFAGNAGSLWGGTFALWGGAFALLGALALATLAWRKKQATN